MLTFLYLIFMIQVITISGFPFSWKNDSYQETIVDLTEVIMEIEENEGNVENSYISNEILNSVSKNENEYYDNQGKWNDYNNLKEKENTNSVNRKKINKRDLPIPKLPSIELPKIPTIPSPELPKLPSIPTPEIPKIPSPLEMLPELPEFSPEELLEMPKLNIQLPDFVNIKLLNKREIIPSDELKITQFPEPIKSSLISFKENTENDLTKEIKDKSLRKKLIDKENSTNFVKHRENRLRRSLTIPKSIKVPLLTPEIIQESNNNNRYNSNGRRGRKGKCDNEKITYKETTKITIHKEDSDESKEKEDIVSTFLSKLPNPFDILSLAPSIEKEKNYARRPQREHDRDDGNECKEIVYEDVTEVVVYEDSEESSRKLVKNQKIRKNPIPVPIVSQLIKPISYTETGKNENNNEILQRGLQETKNKKKKRNVNQMEVKQQNLYEIKIKNNKTISKETQTKIQTNVPKSNKQDVNEIKEKVDVYNDNDYNNAEEDYEKSLEENNKSLINDENYDYYDLNIDDQIKFKNIKLNKKSKKYEEKYNKYYTDNLNRNKREIKNKYNSIKPKQNINNNKIIDSDNNKNMYLESKTKSIYDNKYFKENNYMPDYIIKLYKEILEKNLKEKFNDIEINRNKRETDTEINTVIEEKVTVETEDNKITTTEEKTTKIEFDENKNITDDKTTNKEEVTTTTTKSTTAEPEETTEYEYEAEDENCPNDVFGAIMNGIKCVFNFVASKTVGIEIGAGCC